MSDILQAAATSFLRPILGLGTMFSASTSKSVVAYNAYVCLTFLLLVGEWYLRRGTRLVVVAHPDANINNPDFSNFTHLTTVNPDGSRTMLERTCFSLAASPSLVLPFFLLVAACVYSFLSRKPKHVHIELILLSYGLFGLAHFPFLYDFAVTTAGPWCTSGVVILYLAIAVWSETDHQMGPAARCSLDFMYGIWILLPYAYWEGQYTLLFAIGYLYRLSLWWSLEYYLRHPQLDISASETTPLVNVSEQP
jgi:hypothetical protein